MRGHIARAAIAVRACRGNRRATMFGRFKPSRAMPAATAPRGRVTAAASRIHAPARTMQFLLPSLADAGVNSAAAPLPAAGPAPVLQIPVGWRYQVGLHLIIAY